MTTREREVRGAGGPAFARLRKPRPELPAEGMPWRSLRCWLCSRERMSACHVPGDGSTYVLAGLVR